MIQRTWTKAVAVALFGVLGLLPPLGCKVPGADDEVCGAGGGGGAGGGDGGGGGDGSPGEDAYAFCSDACSEKCDALTVNGFSPAVFKFVLAIPDDGSDDAGGWQVASAVLKFVRWTKLTPEAWVCPVTVGMPLRTAADGKISPDYAASVSARVATDASRNVKNSSPDLPPGIYCSKLKPEMQRLFKLYHPTLGAKMM